MFVGEKRQKRRIYHVTRTAPRTLSLQNYRENPRMSAVRKEKRGGRIIKCLLNELGRAERENILGPYVMTSGQIVSRPALSLSQ